MTEYIGMVTKRAQTHALVGFGFGVGSLFICWWIYVYPYVNILRMIPLVGTILSIAGVLNQSKRVHRARWLGPVGLGLNVVALVVSVFLLTPEFLVRNLR